MPSSEQQVANWILDPMQAVYAKPMRIDDPDGALAQYGRALRRFDAADLEAGWDRLVATHRGGSWPSIGVIVAAVQDAEDRRRKDAPASVPQQVPEATRRFGAADRVLKSPIGRRACEEGWNLSLWVFAYNEERAPSEPEIARMKRDCAEFDRCLAGLADSERPLDLALNKTAHAMLGKRERMAKHYWPDLAA